MFRSFAIGAVIGLLASLAYIMFGSWGWYVPKPIWAQVVFFPGVIAGHSFYYHCCSEIVGFHLAVSISKAVGVLTMILVCGALGCVVHAMVVLRREIRWV